MILLGIFFCTHGMEQPPKPKTFFPQLLEGFINTTRCSSAGKYYLSQAACHKLHKHFHFGVHSLTTRALLYEKKLMVPHLFKFSPRDTYLAISSDGIQLEILHAATGEIAFCFKMGFCESPDNFVFSSNEKLLKYLVCVSKKAVESLHTQVIDLTTMKALECLPHPKTRFMPLKDSQHDNLEVEIPIDNSVFYYKYPYQPAQFINEMPMLLKNTKHNQQNRLLNFVKDHF